MSSTYTGDKEDTDSDEDDSDIDSETISISQADNKKAQWEELKKKYLLAAKQEVASKMMGNDRASESSSELSETM